MPCFLFCVDLDCDSNLMLWLHRCIHICLPGGAPVPRRQGGSHRQGAAGEDPAGPGEEGGGGGSQGGDSALHSQLREVYERNAEQSSCIHQLVSYSEVACQAHTWRSARELCMYQNSSC
jgi:hypothetical protein